MSGKNEANLHDQINSTKFWLEFDQKLCTMTNINNWKLPKILKWQMLTIEHRPKNILQYIIFLQRQTVMLSLTKPWQWQT